MSKVLLAATLACLIASIGCSKPVDLEKVPPGTKVEVTRQDGGVVSGTVAALDDTTLTVAAGPASHSVPRDQIVGVQVVEEPAVATPPPATFRTITLPAGTMLVVRLNSTVGSASSSAGDPVTATLTDPVVVDGTEVIATGSVASGEVASVRSSGKVKGRGSIAIVFRSLSIAGGDEVSPIDARVSRTAPGAQGKDTAKIAIPAIGGAIVGGLLGGKKGVLIGTAIGGGAGTAVVLSTRGPQILLPQGTVLSIRLEHAIDVRVPIASR
jgi:hypothetical protein